MARTSTQHTADLIVLNGNVVTVAQNGATPPRARAVAIRAGRVLAVGADDEMRALAAADVQIVNVEGRTVIPGLNESHLHRLRAGLTWNEEVGWEQVREMDSGLRMLRDDATRKGPDAWIRVVGCWHPGQFAERRTPTREDLHEFAPENPSTCNNGTTGRS